MQIGKIKLDEWQKKVLNTEGNIALRSGRQVGKSTIIAVKAAEKAANNPNQTIMVISAVERQARLLFEKIIIYLEKHHKKKLKKGKDRPTKHKCLLKNGSKIYSLPTGLSGRGIRGYTLDLLIADEAAFIPKDVWTAITPELAMTGGDIWLLSTPHGKGGYFFDSFSDDNYTKFHISTEEILNQENRPKVQLESLRKKLETEKKRMSKLQYAQEYLGEFADELRQIFPDKLIAKTCRIKRGEHHNKGKKYLGCDIAGFGEDEITFEILQTINNDQIIQKDNIVKKKQTTTQTAKDIKHLNKKYNFSGIGIDDAGIGFGVWSELKEDFETKRKTHALNNASREIDKDRKKKLLKEIMYMNLLSLMEGGKIALLDDDNLIQSLKSIQYEYIQKKGQKTRLRIFGNYTHIAEGLIRAAWLASKQKSLNIFIRSF